MKKVIGAIFIILAAFLIIILIPQVPMLLDTIGLTFSGDTYSIGYSIGVVAYFVFHLGVTFVLIKYGIRWLKVPAEYRSSTTLDEDLIEKN